MSYQVEKEAVLQILNILLPPSLKEIQIYLMQEGTIRAQTSGRTLTKLIPAAFTNSLCALQGKEFRCCAHTALQ